MKILRTAIVMLLLSATATAAGPETLPFEWDTLLAASIKLQKNYNYEAIADSYLQVFEPTVWNHVKEDEFKLQKERKRVVAQAAEEVDRFSLDKCVRLNTWLNLGTYNFESESFPVTNMKPGHYWSEYRYRSAGFPSTLCLYLTNSELLATLPMPADDAEALLARRKDSKGRINRRIEVTLIIKVTGLKGRSKTNLYGEIQSATIYHDRAEKLVLREVVKSRATKPGPATDKASAGDAQNPSGSTPQEAR